MGAEAVQIFVSNPRGWAQPALDESAAEEFGADAADRALPVFVHTPYLVNLGSPSSVTVERSLRDRHENIGAGGIGASAFAALLRHPAVRDVPVVVETPAGEVGHAADIALLKKLRQR